MKIKKLFLTALTVLTMAAQTITVSASEITAYGNGTGADTLLDATFYDEDGTVLSQTSIRDGEIPSYTGPDLTSLHDGKTFIGWKFETACWDNITGDGFEYSNTISDSNYDYDAACGMQGHCYYSYLDYTAIFENNTIVETDPTPENETTEETEEETINETVVTEKTESESIIETEESPTETTIATEHIVEKEEPINPPAPHSLRAILFLIPTISTIFLFFLFIKRKKIVFHGIFSVEKIDGIKEKGEKDLDTISNWLIPELLEKLNLKQFDLKEYITMLYECGVFTIFPSSTKMSIDATFLDGTPLDFKECKANEKQLFTALNELNGKVTGPVKVHISEQHSNINFELEFKL